MVEIVDPVFYVAAGGAAGAVSRHMVSSAVSERGFPVNTLAVNVIGSLALGFLAFGGFGSSIYVTFGTGACGAFTTFSSFSFETVRMYETGEKGRAVFNAAINLAGGLAGVSLAWGITKMFL